MKAAYTYLIARLSEPSTYRGIFALLTAMGIAIQPDQAAAITALGLSLIGCVNVFRKEDVKLLPFALGLFLLPSCGTTSTGEKTFFGVTGSQFLTIGKNIAKREALPVMGEIQDARATTAAKNPVKVQ